MSQPQNNTSVDQRHNEEIELLNAAHKDKVAKLQVELDVLNNGDGNKSDALSPPTAPAAAPYGGKFSKDSLILALWLVANVSSVVLCVGFNKVLYKPPYNFNFASSLMCFHFIFTYCFVVTAKTMGWFVSKKHDHEVIYVRLGLAGACAVGFVNMSLFHNTVGMYQLFKFTNILVICGIEYLWKKKTYSGPIYLALCILTVGVLIATVKNIDMTPKGLFWGIAGSLAVAVYQITNKATQTDFDLKALQLMEFEQPYTVLWTGIFALMTDDIRGLFAYQFNTKVVILLFCSGFFAFGVNVTSYMIIGKTGPVTYGVVGHSKAVCVMLFGFIALNEVPAMNTSIGMLIAFCAIIWYTHLSTSAATKQ